MRGASRVGGGVKKRKCGTCRFFQEGNLAGSGWCHHPQRKTTSDLMIMVRSNELACRNQWADDLWQATSGDGQEVVSNGSAVAPYSVQRMPPATERDIAAVVQANSDAETSGTGAADIPEDVVLSEGGLRIDVDLHSGDEIERTPASREQTPRTAIIRAHESARERRRIQDERSHGPAVSGYQSPAAAESTRPVSHVGNGSDPNDDRGSLEAPRRPVDPSTAAPEERFDTIPERKEAFDLPLRFNHPPVMESEKNDEQHDALSPTEVEALVGYPKSAARDGESRAPVVADNDGARRTGIGGHDLSSANERGKTHVQRAAPRVDLVRESSLFRGAVSPKPDRERISVSPPNGSNETARTSPQDLNHGNLPDHRRGARSQEFTDDLLHEPDDSPTGPEDDLSFDMVSDGEGRGQEDDHERPDYHAVDAADVEPLARTVNGDGVDDTMLDAAMLTGSGDEDTVAGIPPSDDGYRDMDDFDDTTSLETVSTAHLEAEPAQVAVSLAPELPRQCRTCRDFRPAEGGERGWCANEWAFTHRRMVSGTDQMPCATTLGSWWLPVDQVWAAKADVSAHGQPTPLMDALLDHLGLLEWGRETPARERRRS